MVFSCPGGGFRVGAAARAEAAGAAARTAAAEAGKCSQNLHFSSFSTGFRSYVRQFLRAIFMLLRPSVPWCFAVREVAFEQQQQQQQRQQQQQEKVAKIFLFYRFQKLR